MPEEPVPQLQFNIYVRDGAVTTVFDENDPQRAELMQAMAAVFNAHNRPRDADQCLKHGTVTMSGQA